ncbi:MAG: cyclodeaminase [Spirochaetota bacterium]
MKPNNVLVLTERELQKLVKLDLGVVEAVEQGFAFLADGKAAVPPIMMIPVPDQRGEVDIKSAYIQGLPSLAVKIASGFFNNSNLGLPSQSGQMLVLSAETGFLQAVLLDNGYLTQVRTAAAGAVAAKYLAPKNVECVGVFGSGVQAEYQLEALALVRAFDKVYLFSTSTREKKEAFAQRIAQKLGVEVVQAESGNEVVANCSVVITATPSREGFLQADWLHPGLHITAMGSDTEEKQELKPEVFSAIDVIACDLRTQSLRLGELRSAISSKVVTEHTPVLELGDIIRGKHSGRADEKQITVCDLTGVGVQDTMIALKAYELAQTNNTGTHISL